MQVDYIALAVPFLFVIIILEFIFSLVKKRKYFRLNDSISNISCGLIEITSSIFYGGLTIFGYIYLYNNFSIFKIPENNLTFWVLCFITQDFLYYWFHRAGHEINFFWAGHSVHHQSEDYNLTVAFRQSFVQDLQSWVFYLPMAVIGFSPLMYLSVRAFNPLYQFWIHTETIRKLGWFEKIFNTPSHHRVHHGVNPQYLDKNYAGTLMIWDKMFGTFAEEKEQVKYGVTEKLQTWNPLLASFKPWQNIYEHTKTVPGIFNKFLAFIKKPGWHPEHEPEIKVDLKSKKYDTSLSRKRKLYVIANYLIILGTAIYINVFKSTLTTHSLIHVTILIVASATILGSMADKRSWPKYAEFIRVPYLFYVLTLIMAGY